MIDWSQYKSDFPFGKVNRDKLFEGRGIPNIIKEYTDIISDDIKNENDDYYFNSYNIRIQNNEIKLRFFFTKNTLVQNLYATSEYQPFTIKINHRGYYDDSELKKVITHELLHIFEISNRIENNSKKDLQWGVSNILQNIRNEFLDDEFLRDFIYQIYLSFDHEINARVSEVYPILMELKTTDKEILFNKLKNTPTYNYCKDLLNFDYNTYDINYDKLFKFFEKFNGSVIEKYPNINFNLYKIPNSKKDINLLLKEWSRLFKKKGEYFHKKLSIIIEEVINDVNMINTATIEYDESLNFSAKYVLTYDMFLERQSKIYKLIRK